MSDLTMFLLARLAEDEAVAQALLRDLEGQIAAEGFAADERGPFTPARMLAAQLWAHYDGQTQWRNFARGQHIATLATPARVLAECESKRRIVVMHVAYPTPQHMVGGTIIACLTCGSVDDCPVEWPCDTLCALALPYADHPDFREEWRA